MLKLCAKGFVGVLEILCNLIKLGKPMRKNYQKVHKGKDVEFYRQKLLMTHFNNLTSK